MRVLNSLKNKKVLAGACSAGAFFVFWFLFLSSSSTSSRTPVVVLMSEQGFVPQEITVSQGQIIMWKNIGSDERWPASNLHPTHSIYSDFDPKRPINQKETWTFRFKKPGSWKYHDHIAPGMYGTVTVLDGAAKAKDTSYHADCEQEENKSREDQCWQKQVTLWVEDMGIQKAFKKFASEFAVEKGDCHQYAHLFGELAYSKVKDAVDEVLFTEDSLYCSFGFWHGFVSASIQNEGSAAVMKLCDNVSEADIKYNCYHGVGTGLMDDDFSVGANVDPVDIVEPPLTLCSQLAPLSVELEGCATGVFHVLIEHTMKGEVDFTFNKEDPLRLCMIQKSEYQKPCYLQLAARLPHALNMKSMQPLLPFLLTIERGLALEIVPVSSFRLVHDILRDGKKMIESCREIGSDFKRACLNGGLRGFAEAFPRTERRERTKVFCASDFLLPDEKKTCFSLVEGL